MVLVSKALILIIAAAAVAVVAAHGNLRVVTSTLDTDVAAEHVEGSALSSWQTTLKSSWSWTAGKAGFASLLVNEARPGSKKASLAAEAALPGSKETSLAEQPATTAEKVQIAEMEADAAEKAYTEAIRLGARKQIRQDVVDLFYIKTQEADKKLRVLQEAQKKEASSVKTPDVTEADEGAEVRPGKVSYCCTYDNTKQWFHFYTFCNCHPCDEEPHKWVLAGALRVELPQDCCTGEVQTAPFTAHIVADKDILTKGKAGQSFPYTHNDPEFDKLIGRGKTLGEECARSDAAVRARVPLQKVMMQKVIARVPASPHSSRRLRRLRRLPKAASSLSLKAVK